MLGDVAGRRGKGGKETDVSNLEVSAGRELGNQAGGPRGRLVLGGRLVGSSEGGASPAEGEGEEGEPRSWEQKRLSRLIAGRVSG